MDKSFIGEVSAFMRFVCNVVAGATIICLGVFLLLVGTHVIPLTLKDVAVPSILLAFGITFIVTGLLQRNSVAFWLSFFFIMPAIIILLINYVSCLSYSNMYPFFIAIPAFASLFTLIYNRQYRVHIATIVFFTVLSILFGLESFGIAGWGIVIPLMIIFIGAIILFYAFNRKKV